MPPKSTNRNDRGTHTWMSRKNAGGQGPGSAATGLRRWEKIPFRSGEFGNLVPGEIQLGEGWKLPRRHHLRSGCCWRCLFLGRDSEAMGEAVVIDKKELGLAVFSIFKF